MPTPLGLENIPDDGYGSRSGDLFLQANWKRDTPNHVISIAHTDDVGFVIRRNFP